MLPPPLSGGCLVGCVFGLSGLVGGEGGGLVNLSQTPDFVVRRSEGHLALGENRFIN